MAKREDRPRRLGLQRLGADQLTWVARNRQQGSRHSAVGAELRHLDLTASGSAPRTREIYDAINSLVDAPFRACCRFDDYHGGTVRILVNPPEMLYHVRSVWQARLLRELGQNNRRGTIRKIVFVALKDDDADRPERGGVRFFKR